MNNMGLYVIMSKSLIKKRPMAGPTLEKILILRKVNETFFEFH